MIDRRAFITVVGGSILAQFGEAQEVGKIRRLSVLPHDVAPPGYSKPFGRGFASLAMSKAKTSSSSCEMQRARASG